VSKENQDYYKLGGRSGGPAGPLDHFKGELARSRAGLARKSKGRRPKRKQAAAAEVERQLADLDGGTRRSVLDDLPSTSGPAGVPAGRRPADPHPEPTWADGAFGGPDDGAYEGAPAGEPVPADQAVAEREAAPWADEDAAGAPTGPRLGPVPSAAVRALAPAFRLLGGAARLVDRPVRRALQTLIWLEREARGKA
jgi:hypothetical protein